MFEIQNFTPNEIQDFTLRTNLESISRHLKAKIGFKGYPNKNKSLGQVEHFHPKSRFYLEKTVGKVPIQTSRAAAYPRANQQAQSNTS